MAEPIEMQFVMLSQVGPGNVLHGNVDSSTEGALSTARRYASAVLGVVILSVRTSICHMRAL